MRINSPRLSMALINSRKSRKAESPSPVSGNKNAPSFSRGALVRDVEANVTTGLWLRQGRNLRRPDCKKTPAFTLKPGVLRAAELTSRIVLHARYSRSSNNQLVPKNPADHSA